MENLKFNIEQYNKSNPLDLIECECFNCKNIFLKEKRHISYSLTKSKWNEGRYCSLDCFYKSRDTSVDIKCAECGIDIKRRKKEIKSLNSFCSRSCSASYNNRNKKTGTRRSKLEAWIEEELKKIYDFEIVFNGKDAINSELDIYIPNLNLAFELNGIFHYEPIYGQDKLERVKNNDNRKFQACLENKIELCILDVSGSKHFKPERDKKYLEIIKNLIDNKMTTFFQQQQQQGINRTD